MDTVFQAKLNRMLAGEKPRVLDTFAGCGGMSLGFHSAGFEIKAAIEFDKHAALSHAINFHDADEKHAQPVDITLVEPQEFADMHGLGDVEMAFDVVIGGPPCQAYARVGRAALRSAKDSPNAYKEDKRGSLYLRYLHYVRATKPLAVAVENVTDALNYGGQNVMQEIANALKDLGYNVKYTILNASFFGVPQTRDRAFLIAVHSSVGEEVTFPEPTHHIVLPAGYDGSRAVAYKGMRKSGCEDFVEPVKPSDALPPAVTTRQALEDLPVLKDHILKKQKKVAKRFEKFIPYSRDVGISDYAESMRSWPGFEAKKDGVKDHVIRNLSRDTDIFKKMPNGGQYPEAYATAVELFNAEVKKREKETSKKLDASELGELRKSMVPPYPVHTFPNRWWKMREDFPSRTLLAHIGKDTYSHIHYDSEQARVMSVREAARLQSFPDGFVFAGTMNPAYKQIGNAVAPLMSRALAVHIKSMMMNTAEREKAA